jgi:leucyl/phenylalanyl-tRNA--protein transferase
MILPYLDESTDFPDSDQALTEPDGLLCFGGDLSIDRLFAAYSKGIFPWYSAAEPIMWWCPSDRMVLFPQNLHVSRSLNKFIKLQQPKFYFNRNFKTVITHCANIPRNDQGTWIHTEMIAAYSELFNAGHAFCLEVEINGQLAGGIYGVQVGQVFCGESMFSLKTNGSKLAMYGLCQHMQQHDIKLLDCQLHNPHLESMGAQLITREEFLGYLPQS